ncbi:MULTISPECIES: hypothetical protein [Streptomyces]|uniref:Lipoprotein n=1 Tax=Streptomyces amritsarensis TaxID=681158 RepID=A0ABX3GCR3_9ACTN|nr:MULTISPECIES: hypothetical protein [Streptomyces]AQT75478.1 hypothetical protein B1K54_31015 [Streptomyces sp. fd1-xmd]OLZ73153.1 hypothetical protein AVW11_01995 [Streptomyces amritsarensis]
MAQRKGCLIGCGVALVLGIGAVVAVVFGVGKVVDMAGESMVDPAVYEGVKTGDAEGDVRAKLPSGESFVKTALKEGGPVEPEGSTCAWYVSTGEAEMGKETVLRFCFKDGKLVEKTQYPMK